MATASLPNEVTTAAVHDRVESLSENSSPPLSSYDSNLSGEEKNKEQDSNSNQEGAMASEAVERKMSDNDAGLGPLLQRMKSDLMFELRHLQHGDRPVTGQGHRDSLRQFMLKHQATNDSETPTANVDAVEEHRPEAVVVEVQGMIERRPVSSVLQSAAFRRQLENVIRGGFVNADRRRDSTAPSRRRDSTVPSRQTLQQRQQLHQQLQQQQRQQQRQQNQHQQQPRQLQHQDWQRHQVQRNQEQRWRQQGLEQHQHQHQQQHLQHDQQQQRDQEPQQARPLVDESVPEFAAGSRPARPPRRSDIELEAATLHQQITAGRSLQRADSTESIDSFSSARSSVEQDFSDVEDDDNGISSTNSASVDPTQTRDYPTYRTNPRQPELESAPLSYPQSVLEYEERNDEMDTRYDRAEDMVESPLSPVASRGMAGQNSTDDYGSQSSSNLRDQLAQRLSQREESNGELSWGDISRVHREELIQEISALLQSRLVSSTLDSGFRATLELHTQNRLQASGANGPAVQEFVQSLPGRGIPRNDFVDLGIPSLDAWEGDADNVDNISVASVSARSVPYTQTNTYIGRELKSLKSKMAEMASMLKLTFDLQLDIQRSIRQEVSAALSAQATGFDGAAAITNPAPSRPVNDTNCIICLDRHADTVLYQCGHLCVCYTCGHDLVTRGHNCPMCRAPIKDVLRVYRASTE